MDTTKASSNSTAPEFYLRSMRPEELRGHIATAKAEQRIVRGHQSFPHKLHTLERMQEAARSIKACKSVTQ